eukprot:795162-Pyramimonas_sp.AAC.1
MASSPVGLNVSRVRAFRSNIIKHLFASPMYFAPDRLFDSASSCCSRASRGHGHYKGALLLQIS